MRIVNITKTKNPWDAFFMSLLFSAITATATAVFTREHNYHAGRILKAIAVVVAISLAGIGFDAYMGAQRAKQRYFEAKAELVKKRIESTGKWDRYSVDAATATKK